MSVKGPVQSHYHDANICWLGDMVKEGKRSLRWEGFVEKVGFEPGVKVMDVIE